MSEVEKQYLKTIELTEKVSKITGIEKDSLLISYGATLFVSELIDEIEKKKEELLHLDNDVDAEILWNKFHKMLMNFVNTRTYMDTNILNSFIKGDIYRGE